MTLKMARALTLMGPLETIKVEDLDYRMPLIHKVGRLGSLLPWLNILSILLRPAEHRRILLGHLKAILASACGL